MIRLSATLARSGDQLWHWCPGCEDLHAFNIGTPGRPLWSWDGNVERPTLSPSMLCFTVHDEDGETLPSGQRRTLCHYFLRAGVLEYCADTPHALSGKSVVLPDLPAWVGA